MSIFQTARSPWTARLLSVLRIVVGLMFMLHGTQKMFGFPPNPQMQGMSFNLMSQIGLAGILETFGGALIVLGLLTRPVAFLLAGEMAVAYFQAHFPRGFYPVVNGGEPAVLYCFIFLYFMMAGAGPWSVDAMLAGRDSGVGSADSSGRRYESAA
jgi:putative oxidoreductase